MRHAKRRMPRSRDEMANTLFKILVYFLSHEVRSISWVKNLRDTEERGRGLNGMNRKKGSKYEIFLHEDLQTNPFRAIHILVHETFHCLSSMDTNETEEWLVRKLTAHFWKRGTSQQKLFLLRFLPAFDHYSRQPRQTSI